MSWFAVLTSLFTTLLLSNTDVFAVRIHRFPLLSRASREVAFRKHACKPRQTALAQKDSEKKLEGRHWHTELVLQRSYREWPAALEKLHMQSLIHSSESAPRAAASLMWQAHGPAPPHQAAITPANYGIRVSCRPSPQHFTLWNHNQEKHSLENVTYRNKCFLYCEYGSGKQGCTIIH